MNYELSARVECKANYVFDTGSTNWDSSTFTISVAKVNLTISVHSYEIDTITPLPEYGFDIVTGSLVGNDALSDLGTYTITCTAAEGAGAGVYPITATFGNNGNYNVSVASQGSLKIVQYVVDLSGSVIKNYGSVDLIDAAENIVCDVSEGSETASSTTAYSSKVAAYSENMVPVLSVSVDITENPDGSSLEVRIKIPEKYLEDKSVLLLCVNDSGNLERVIATYEDGYVYFKTNESATYVLIAKEVKMEQKTMLIIIGAGVGGLIIIAAVLTGILAVRKNKKRRKEKLARDKQFEKLISNDDD